MKSVASAPADLGAWGDGSDAPSWGDAAQTAAISAKLAEAAQSSAEQASAKR